MPTWYSVDPNHVRCHLDHIHFLGCVCVCSCMCVFVCGCAYVHVCVCVRMFVCVWFVNYMKWIQSLWLIFHIVDGNFGIIFFLPGEINVLKNVFFMFIRSLALWVIYSYNINKIENMDDHCNEQAPVVTGMSRACNARVRMLVNSNRLNWGHGQNKIEGAYIHHVGIEIHTFVKITWLWLYWVCGFMVDYL